jgi:hypothetical protein
MSGWYVSYRAGAGTSALSGKNWPLAFSEKFRAYLRNHRDEMRD